MNHAHPKGLQAAFAITHPDHGKKHSGPGAITVSEMLATCF
jgi:hypothetical protein